MSFSSKKGRKANLRIVEKAVNQRNNNFMNYFYCKVGIREIYKIAILV